jgi:hypothetical protein
MQTTPATPSYRVHPTLEDAGTPRAMLEFPTRSEESDYGTHVEIPKIREHVAACLDRAAKMGPILAAYRYRLSLDEKPLFDPKAKKLVDKWLRRLEAKTDASRQSLALAALYLSGAGAAMEPYMAGNPAINATVEHIRTVESAVLTILGWRKSGRLPEIVADEFTTEETVAYVERQFAELRTYIMAEAE